MIVDSVWQRHQDGGAAHDGQLGNRQRAGPAQHQVGPAVGRRHVLDKRVNPRSLIQQFAIALPDDGKVRLPCLVPKLQLTAAVANGPQGRRQHLVDRFGAQTPAQYQQVQRPLAGIVVLSGGAGPQQRAAHGIAQHHRLDVFPESARKRRHYPPGQGRQHPVGGAGNRVLLMDQQRLAQQPRRHSRRPGHVAAHAHHTARRQPIQQPQRLHGSEQQEADTQQLVDHGFATHAANRQAVQCDARGGYYPVLEAPGRSHPLHPQAARHQFRGDRECRVDMPAGTTGGHQDKGLRGGAHIDLAPWRVSRSIRSTSASMQQQTIRLVPP